MSTLDPADARLESAQLDTDTETAAATEAFTLFAVFRLSSSHPLVIDGRDVPGSVRELEDVTELIDNEGVTLRGWYDVSGMRSDADLMVWLHGSAAEDLQWALRELRRSSLLKPLIRTWSAMGVHRDAEFNRSHVPGFMRGESARQWLAVYPFVRSTDWYLIDPRSTVGRARPTPESWPTPWPRSRSATTSGCCPWKPTSSPSWST
jgi:chlorite dismutase